MPGRSLKASSARPSQTPLEGRADDASCLTSNTVAHPAVTLVARRRATRAPPTFNFASTPLAFRLGGLALSQKRAR